MLESQPQKDLICDICMKCFCSVSKYNRHTREQHNKESTGFQCEVCERKFKRKEHLKRHVRTFHQGKKIPCPLCVLTFGEPYKLKNHLQEKHEVLRCDKCSMIVRSADLQKHDCQPDSSSINKSTFGCRICRKRYSRKEYLIKHLTNIHLGDDENQKPLAEAQLRSLRDNIKINEVVYRSRSNSSNSNVSEQSFIELEIGVEYDALFNEVNPEDILDLPTKKTLTKRDCFSGRLKIPSNLRLPNNSTFGEINLNKSFFREYMKKVEKETSNGIFGSINKKLSGSTLNH